MSDVFLQHLPQNDVLSISSISDESTSFRNQLRLVFQEIWPGTSFTL